MEDPQQALVLEAVQRLNDIGIALSHEPDEEQVLERILVAAKDLTRSDGGTLYSVVGEGKQRRLRFRLMLTDSLNIARGGRWGGISDLPEIALWHDGKANHSSVVAHAVLEQTTILIEDAYEVEAFDFSGTRDFDTRTGYRSKAMLTVPLRDHRNEVIAVLQLLNPLDAEGSVGSFGEAQVRLVESLASQASMMLSKGLLLQEVSDLFESLVKLIASAIDEKSPYTGGHCRRVPELTMALAEAADHSNYGSIADFHLSREERYELHIASWLHDCGKITTPEWIMDKATKLQCLHDRIHELAVRCANCRQQAEIAYWKACAQGQDPDQAAAARDAELEAVNQDLDFLRRVNLGGEWMSDADCQRVQSIAQRTWLDAHGKWQPLLYPDEVENLCIRKGTLLPSERQIINDHIRVTIAMLEKLPFPKHLSRVPEIAGGHHERMDGRGYPKGLRREDMSVQARCMGIADIFEALTANDRPYKRPMSLSQALSILGRMSLDQHIDPELFEIFVRHGVWRKYAEKHLDASQIDAVNIHEIPGYSGSPIEDS